MNYEKAERIRDVLRYVRRFKDTSIVIHIDDTIIDSPFFLSHIKDICHIHTAGLKVVIVPGAKKRIDDVLEKSGITWQIKDSLRITDESAIPLIKMAAFDTANRIMTSLAGERRTALIGNWVKARGRGIVDGLDFSTCGEIDSIEIHGIQNILQGGFIPIFPCIGWSTAGKPYNISSTSLAAEIAICLQSEKLFYLTPDVEITPETFSFPNGLQVDKNETIPAMNIEQASAFISLNNKLTSSLNTHHKSILELLDLSVKACNAGVVRSHIVNGSVDGSLPCEIFSDLGTGTMIYKSNYGGIRTMTHEDIPSVLNLMRPFIEKSIILARTEQDLLDYCEDYIVYEMDGGIKACAALHLYKSTEQSNIQAEIAAVVVDKTCSRIGIGPKLISYLVEHAKKKNASSIFVLTTQTSDWFEAQGFTADDIESLPLERKEKWSKKRASKLFRVSF